MKKTVVPRHIALIMDGNGRWAKKRHLPRVAGHKVGGETLRKIITHSRKKGVRYVTIYAFSTENWKRPTDEVSSLMSLFGRYLENELPTLTDNQVRFRVIGDRSRLGEALRAKMESVEAATAHLEGMDLICAISYGGRDELVKATREIAKEVVAGNLDIEAIDESAIASRLYTHDVPDPDLLIRTSGEMRISNFLLWQIAYSEIIVTPVLWPDFDESELDRCIDEYCQRDRRYGLIKEPNEE